jgi:hypothetical protein
MLLRSLKNIFLVLSIGLLITACSTSAKKTTAIKKVMAQVMHILVLTP